MSLDEYFHETEGYGVLATADADGNVDAAVYARPYFIDEKKIAFSMLERLSYKNVKSNPKAVYIFRENSDLHAYEGKRLYLTMVGEETDQNKVKQIKLQYASRYSVAQSGKHFVYFKITKIRPLVGGIE